MKKRMILWVLFLSVLGFTACKDDDTLDPQPSMEDLRAFFQANEADAVQTFTVNANSYEQITGSKGTVVTFYGYGFTNALGLPVSGNVDIELIEIFDKADMILLNKPTMGLRNGQLVPLVSGGELKLTASQNGQALNVQGGSFSITVPAPDGTTPLMDLFYGTESGDSTIWVTDTTTTWDTTFVTGPIVTGPNYYDIFPSGIGWINCDYFYSDPRPLTEAQVQLPRNFDHSNTTVFISFDGLNAITNMYDGAGNLFSTGMGYELPIGLNVHFIALSYVGGVPYVAIVPATISNNHLTVIGAMQATTPAQLAIDLGNLP